MKKRINVLLVVFLVFLLLTACTSGGDVNDKAKDTSAISQSQEIRIIDDGGNEIVLSEPAKTIISMYSTHTENLYSLGLDEEIIGVGTSDTYPEDVLTKTQYSYKDDPELVIAANPDVVLARTMILNRYPEYFEAIEKAGITVVNLYCSEFDQFDDYITKVGLIVGKDDEAKALLEEFHEKIAVIQNNAKQIEDKKTAYFESIGKSFKTATPTSFAGTALDIIGLENIAKDIEYDGSTTVVEYGEESLFSKANDIDVYIAQKGTMNKTVSIDEVKERPGYSVMKSIQGDAIYIIDEKLISSATLRYLDGLKELQDKIYGDKIS